MIKQISDDFDLEKIAESGQCFRWEKAETAEGGLHSFPEIAALPEIEESNLHSFPENSALPEIEEKGLHSFPENSALPEIAGTAGNIIRRFTYRIIAGKSCLYITALDERRGIYALDCSEEEYSGFWHRYFDLDENYRRIRERIDPEKDPFLLEAVGKEKGIRILRQDPWEMLITFIISQNKNIPGIRRCVELLARSCGEKRIDSRGIAYYAFPTPQEICALSDAALADCRLGYRCKYVKAAAEAVLAKKIDLNQLSAADEKTAIASLTALYGVGVKVANCVSLFGLHHVDAFPVDVWVKRILAKEYPDGYPFQQYSPYNGIYQQYMFAYYRHLASGKEKTGD